MTRLLVSYEWVTEELDEHGDIAYVNGWGSFLGAVTFAKSLAPQKVDIALTASWGHEDVGLKDREYAYLEGGKLPDTLDGGHKVPKRFHDEVSNAAQT